MRLHLGPIPDSDFAPEEPWRALREPSPWVMQFCALPFGLLAAFAVGAGWKPLLDAAPVTIKPSEGLFAMAALVLSFPLIVVVHELLHAATFPRGAGAGDVVIGAWPSRGMFYAHYHGQLSRNRLFVTYLTPLVGISLVPLALFWAVRPEAGFATFFAAWCSIWNALFACGDLFAVALIFAQVPGRAVVRNKGYRTYWRAG